MSPKRLVELDRRARRRAFGSTVAWVVTVWVVLIGVYHLVPSRAPSTGVGVVALVGGGVLFGTVLVWQVRRILRAEIPQLRAVEAFGMLVPLFLVLFASAYASLSAGYPGHFTQELDRSDALYFTVTVLTTVGFGDIAPVSTSARNLVTLQMVLDTVLIAALARFVIFQAKLSLRRSDDKTPAAEEA